MRIERHPILDIPENREKVTIYVNGEPIEAVKGEVVAARFRGNPDIRHFGKLQNTTDREAFSVRSEDVQTVR